MPCCVRHTPLGDQCIAPTSRAVPVGGATISRLVLSMARRLRRLRNLVSSEIIDAHCDQGKFCDQTGMNAVDRASSLQNQSTVFLLIGAAGVTNAIGLAIAGANSTEGSVTAVVLPSGAGLNLQRSF